MKKIGLILLGAILTLGAIGCGSKTNNSTTSEKTTEDKKVITVGASPVPHKEILDQIKPLLEKSGYTLEIKEFTDYVTPNIALNEGEIDANFFQHIPYLNKNKEEKHLDLNYTVKVHIEPMGLYSKKLKSIKELKNGATIAIPNDSTNCARALRVLEKQGLIKVKEGELVTKLDITENKNNLKFEELDAPQLPRVLTEVDAAIINVNYALEANLNPTKDALIIESTDSPYANILAVRASDKNKPYIQALSKALNSPELKKYIQEKYNGSIIPAF